MLVALLDAALHLSFGGDLDLAQLRAHAGDVLGEVRERALESVHLALDPRARDGQLPGLVHELVDQVGVHAQERRPHFPQLGRQRLLLGHRLRRRRDHRERGGLVLLLLEDGRYRDLDRDEVLHVLAAREPLQSDGEAVDPLLGLLEFLLRGPGLGAHVDHARL